jgi:S-adenosylmethionine decarboxylase
VHSWPERDFAAFDVFMCGDAKPENAGPVLQRYFEPAQMNISQYHRGVVNKELITDSS